MRIGKRPGKQITLFLFAALLGVLALGAFGGCNTSPEATAGTGTLQMKLVDTPVVGKATETDAITVTIDRVEIHRAAAVGEDEDDDSGWITVVDATKPLAERRYDLLSLVGGVEAILGEIPLEPGHYTQIRVFVTDPTITIDGVEHDVRIPSAEQTGIKLIHGFDISAGETTVLTLVFDADESVHQTGSGTWMMRPTIRVLQTSASTGSISGTVAPTGIGAVVNVYAAGTTNLVTTAPVNNTTGEFMITGLAAGSYDIQVVANGYATATQTGILVAAGGNSGGHSFTLVPTGATGSISGMVGPIGISAVVNVYAAGTTNLVTTVPVNNTTGEFMVSGLVAGTYDIQVVANGYVTATQTGIVVTAGANSGGHSFTLLPTATGSISGTVTPTGISAVVNVYAAGTTNLVATVPVNNTTGEFMVSGLAAGTYDIQVVATGYLTGTLTGIVVTAGADSGGHLFTMAPVGP
jgi:hypothetical protein